MAGHEAENPARAARTAEERVSERLLTRRSWLRLAGQCAAALPLARMGLAQTPVLRLGQSQPGPAATLNLAPSDAMAMLFGGVDPTKYRFTRDEETFLEDLERACFGFFWEEANPATGLVKDRSQAAGPDSRNVASIAATGFGLTALCIAHEKGWEDKTKLRDRVAVTLRFVESHVQQAHGFFCHFLNIQTGDRVFQSEVSSIDTAIFICGVLTCRAYFDDPEIRGLADRIYSRVEWSWLLHGDRTISMGWTPERGFIRSRWDSYSELMMAYLLGMGAATPGMNRQNWDSWTRPYFEFNGVRYIGSHAPLFVHQYSHAWFDFRGKRDTYADYFTNSVVATKVHKLWCLELTREYPDYAEDLWGITASDSARGYAVWGGPPAMGRIDGSIVPCAAAGSLPFLPEETIRVLRNIREKYEQRVWRKYGFVDAFNPLTNWYSPDVIGINVGITLLMAENARSGFVWEQFMKNEAAQRGMTRAGFRAVSAAEAAMPPKMPVPNGFPILMLQ